VRLLAGSTLVVTVTDDGVGIDPDARRGVGLTSMRERAEGVGGRFDVRAVEPHGTRVEVRVPVVAEVGS
jgi:two-component system NarL family sensor kinase